MIMPWRHWDLICPTILRIERPTVPYAFCQKASHGSRTIHADLEGRLKCQIGVWQSMIPVIGEISRGIGHAIGHVLGGTCGVPHGYTSCLMAPYVLAWNAPVNGERQKHIAARLGKMGMSAAEAADKFIPSLAMPRTKPRPVSGPEEVMEILRMAAG